MKRKTATGSKRVVRIIGEINPDNYEQFTERMAELEADSHKPIHIELCSHGGDTYVGLAFYGRIKASPCETVITVYGQAMSAATAVFAAGTKRIMHEDAWFMIHDDSQRIRADNGKIAKSEAEHNEVLESHWAELLARHSKPNIAEWRKMSEKTTYLRADECVKMGLAHEVIKS